MKKLLLSLLILLYSSLGFSQLVEGFENTPGISGPLPTTWTLDSGNWTVFEYNYPNPNSGTNQSWGINPFAAVMQYDGIQCASVSREGIGAGNTSEDYLVTPVVSIPATGPAELHFYTRMFTSGDQGTIYRVMVTPSIASQTDAGAYALVSEWTESDLIIPTSSYDIWTEKTVDLSAYAGVDVYIAFVRVYTQPDASLNGDRWLIDNVSLNAEVPCDGYSIWAEYLSSTTVELNWFLNIAGPVEVMILPCDDPAPALTDSGVVVNSNSFQFTNLIEGSCYKAYFKTSCPGADNWNVINLTYNLPRFRLIAFYDANNNGIKDVGEIDFNRGLFHITNNTLGTISSYYNGGEYSFIPNQLTDTFDFGFSVDPYFANCVTLGSFNYDDIPVTTQSQTFYFPIIAIPSCFDNRVILSGYSSTVRAGFNDLHYLLIASNSISSPDSGTLTYTKAANTTIISTTPSIGMVLTPTGFTYDYSSLSLDQPIYLNIRSSIPPIPTVNLGDVLTSSAEISFSPADLNPSNDISFISQTVVSSYDPNDIEESHGPKIQFDQFSQNDYLTYTIRFQNTGNANAIRVRVDNVLDSRIDENSIEMIAARHDYIMVRRENTVSWEFNNIQLPPASVNEDLSNGFITFRVKLKPGFAIGDIIPATASIYFDSNPAIVTETFNTEFVEQLGNPTFNSGSVSLYPNPAKATVQITQTGNEGIEQVAFFDVTGKLVKRISKIINSQEAIDISTLAKGIYFVEITNTADMKTVKKLIIQ
jgi:hypothetical protein